MTRARDLSNSSISNPTIIDAKGDLIAGTAADTAARVAVGTDGQVLTADAASSGGIKWASASAGGMTLISTTSMTGAIVTISSIPQTYNSLYLVIKNPLPVTDARAFRMRFNSDSTASRYLQLTGTTASSATFSDNFAVLTDTQDNVTATGLVVITIPDYTNSTTWKMCNLFSMANNGTTPTTLEWRASSTAYNQTSAISSLQFFYDTGNMTSGTILLYGVK